MRFLISLHPFRLMDAAQLREISLRIKFLSMEKGDFIYKQGDLSQHLYIIFKGKVELSRQEDDEDEPQGTLQDGDLFGFEAWREDQPRRVSARAAEDTSLLYLDADRLYELSEEISTLREYLQLMVDGYQILQGINLEWRESDEPIHYISRIHRVILFARLIAPFLLTLLIEMPLFYVYFLISHNGWLLMASLAVFLAMLGWVLWVVEDWGNDYFVLTDRRIVSWNRVLLLYENRQEAPLESILAVTVRTASYFARRLCFGDVVARTYTGTIFMGKLPNPQQLASMIEDRMSRVQQDRLQKDRLSRIDTIEERLGYKQSPQAVEEFAITQTTETSVPQSVLEWLSSKFQMRTEAGGILTYRTHWYLLLSRTWLQGSLIAGLIILLAVQLTEHSLPLQDGTFITVLATMLLIFSLGWLYGYLDWRNDCYIITADQIIDINKKPLGREEKRAAALKNIQSVEYKRIGLTGLLLNYGTVYVRIGDEEFTFDNVYDPSEVQRELFNRIQRCKHKEKQAETENERQRILDWIEAYHRATHDHPGGGSHEQ